MTREKLTSEDDDGIEIGPLQTEQTDERKASSTRSSE